MRQPLKPIPARKSQYGVDPELVTMRGSDLPGMTSVSLMDLFPDLPPVVYPGSLGTAAVREAATGALAGVDMSMIQAEDSVNILASHHELSEADQTQLQPARTLARIPQPGLLLAVRAKVGVQVDHAPHHFTLEVPPVLGGELRDDDFQQAPQGLHRTPGPRLREQHPLPQHPDQGAVRERAAGPLWPMPFRNILAAWCWRVWVCGYGGIRPHTLTYSHTHIHDRARDRDGSPGTSTLHRFRTSKQVRWAW